MESKEKLNEKDMEEEKPEDVLKALLPDKKLCDKLYPHQREGIVFFFKAYKNEKSRAKGSRNGAILADEMGLGKSIQVILFLHAMIMNTQEFKNALLIVPAGLLNDWKDKLKRWTPNMNVFIYHRSDTELARKLRHLQKMGGILLVSYRMFINNYKALTTYKGMDFFWDCLICDEAHKLKNPATKTHKAVALTSAGFYILITGTPMQNNLREFWSLFSLISDTYVLGTYKTFKNKFENPITKGLEADSGPEERALGMELQRTLEKITEPCWLRRRKDQIQELRGQPLLENIPSDQVLHLPKKNEYVIWIKLSSEQEAAYRKIIDHSSSLTLQSVHSLIAVCTHPRLNSDIKEHEMSGVNLAESGKLTFMLALLEKFTANGNFVLVFSNYIKILDIIEKSLTQTSWGRNAFLRIDGQNSNQRDKIIRKFQKRGSKNILLLTTSVGAEGFTLTAADCVVFADLSWNQSQDAQAVGRAHRIGQTKDVKTYRLITCGTLEEMIYRRQLFKGSLTRQVVGDEKNPFRRFTQDELKAILTLQETQVSSTQQQLEKQGAKCLDITEVFGAGLNSVGFASVCGISDHGQLLSASQGEDLEVAMARMHIKETAEMCQQEIEAESHFARQQICTDVSVKKCGRKAKVRRWSHETRTPGLPRKYKCYTPPFSGRRRKTLHISRPCVFDSSDSSNLSADDEVNLSENTVPHISVTGKSEVMGDSLNQCSASVFMCNNTCSEDNNRLTELLQESACYDAESMSQPSSYSSPNGSYINKSCPEGGIDLKSETVGNSDEDAVNLLSEMSDLLGKHMRYSSLSSDKTKQTAHVSRSSVSDLSVSPSISADEQFSGTIVQREESDTVSDGDQDHVSLSHNISVLSNAHTLRSEMNMMREFELEERTVFQEETNVMGVKSAEARKQEIQLKQDDQIMSSRDTVEFSEHIFQNDPNTDLHKDVSTATDLDNDESSVAVSHIPLNTPVYHEYISTPDNSVSASESMDTTSDFEYCSDSQNHKASISTPTEGSYNFHKDNSIDKNETSLLPEANNISPNTGATESSIHMSMSSKNQVQPIESDKFADLKEEANFQRIKIIVPREQKCEHEEIVHPKRPQNLNSQPSDDPSQSPIPAPSSESQEKTTLNQEDQELQLTSEDLEVDMAKVNIAETVKMCQQEIEAESYLAGQKSCIDVSLKKPDRKAKIRRRSHETRTPGLPRKYKCYTSPFSGRRRKTLHISRPCVFDSSDSSNLSADDEVNLSENTVPHISVTGKSQVTGDSVDLCSAATFMCNTTCCEDNDGISELLQESTYYEDRSSSSSNGSYINKSFSGSRIHLNKSNTVINNDEEAVDLSSEMNEESGKNMRYSSSSHDKTEEVAHVSRSCVSDLNDTSSISVNESFSEDIINFKQSDTVDHNDQGDVTLLCNISVLSNAHEFRSGNTMQESEMGEPTAFHEELIPKGVESAEVEQHQTQVIQDEIMRSRYTLESSDHISKSHPNAYLNMNVSPVTDVIWDMSFVSDLNLDMSASHDYISTLDKTSDSEYCSSHCDDPHNHRTSISSTRDASYNYTFPEDNYMGKNKTSNLQEASSISTNNATGSNICMFMSDVSLVQSSESGNKQEASSQEVKFIDPMEQKLLMNGEQEETVQLKRPLTLNAHACNDPPHSPIPATSFESQEKTTLNQDQELHQAEDRFKTSLKSKQIVPKLCDYSLTPSCLALSITPSASKEKHDTKLKHLNECKVKLNVLKEQTDVQDVKFIDPRGQKDLKKCDYEQNLCPKMFLDLSKQHLNLAHPSSGSSHLLSERETLLNLVDHELADLSSEDRFKSGLKSNQIAPVLCDYSLTPSCLSLSITPSVGKEKHDTKLKQLNECSELNVLKEQTDVQDVKFIDPRGQKDLKKCEYEQNLCPKMFLDLSKQHLNLAHPSSESSHPLSERETLWTVKDYELADLSSEDSFKSGLKSNQIAPVLCDYSLTPGCVSLLDTPCVGKGKHVFSECFQSTPMQSIEVEHQETQDLLKRRLSFSHSHPGNKGNSSTPLESSSKGKPSESVQLKRSEKRTPELPQKYKCFSPSLAKTGKRKITNLDKKVEQQRTTVTGNDSSMAHNAEEHSLSPASSTYRSTRTKCFQSTVSSTTHEYKYGKENHDRPLPAMCSYSFNPSAISQSSKPQTRKITKTCLGQRQLNICEDTDVKSVQKCPTNTETNESRLNTMLVNLLASLNTLSCNNASLRKVQRCAGKQKGQLRKKRLSLKCSRPSFSVTYRKHKKKLLESMGNVCLNQVIEQPQGRQIKFGSVTSDLNVSLITDEHIYALDTEDSASCSSSASCSKFSKGNSSTENTQNSIQCPENDHYYNHTTGVKDIDVSEGGSADSISTINVDVNADQGHHILKEHLSTSFMQFNQFPQTSTLDNHMALQDCNKTSNSESSSHNEDDKDYDYEIEDCKNEIFRLMGDLKRL